MNKRKSGGSRNYILWAGTQASMDEYCRAEESLIAKLNSNMSDQEIKAFLSPADSDDAEERSRLLTETDGVGVISVQGSLTNKDSWFNRYFGVVSYNEIREAFTQALSDDSIHQILFDINSGGGPAAGVSDVADLMSEVNLVKPITTFSDRIMASAAYWLGASGGRVTAGETATVGSIGVILHHTEYSKAMEDAGVGSTVLRSGEFKALMNPWEPLTEIALEEAGSKMDYLYGVFVQNISEKLGVPYPEVDEKMARGREFVGRQALDVGLVGEITTFNTLFNELREKVVASTSNNNLNTLPKELGMKRTFMTATQIAAAVAAGADASLFTEVKDGDDNAHTEGTLQTAFDAAEALEAKGETPKVSSTDLKVQLEAAALAKKLPEGSSDSEPKTAAEFQTAFDAAEALEAKGETPKVSSTDLKVQLEAAALAEKPAGENSEVITLLKTQLSDSNDAVVDLKIELKQLKSDHTAMAESHEGMADIVRASIGNMKVALGGSAVDMSPVIGKDLLVAHEVASKEFTKNFKSGQVSASSPGDDEGKPTSPTLSGLDAAVLEVAATQIQQ